MDSQWETVLIEWINCLSFGKPLQTVEELHDGEFFNNFHKTIKKSTDIICDDLTFIFELLSKHYPKFEIQDKASIHVSNLSRSDLINVTSLLLHYTCIHDRRNVLTSPMCHNLSSATQQHIKSFLEKVTAEISYDALEEVIKSLFIKNLKIPCQLYNSGSSNKATPLQDILRTPTTKMKKMEEKDKEIRTLKRELETEKFYKADLEDDIKDLTDKVGKLETKLQQKCSEVTRLKGEVETMQMCQPPHCQHVDNRETERLLKLELESLQQYIHQCELDHEELRNERDTIKDKVRKLENESTMWQEKYFENDNTIQIYVEHVKELEKKNDNLQTHCVELEGLLDEYRCKSPNSFEESTIIDGYPNRRSKSFEPLHSCEDLAYSVVDVQLRETQKKLEEVLEELNETLEDKMKLEEDMEVYKEKLVVTEGALDKTSVDKERLELKIKQILEENDILVKQAAELQINLEKEEQHKQVLENELTHVQTCLRNAEQEVHKYQGVTDQFNKLKIQQTDNEQKLTEINERLEQVTKTLREEQEELHKEKSEKDALNQEIQKLVKLSDDLAAQNTKNNEEITGMKQINQELAEKLRVLETSHAEAKIRNEFLKTEISTLKSQHEAALADSQGENKRNLFRVKELEIKLAETDNDMLQTKEKLEQVIQEKIIIEKETQEKMWVMEQSIINDKGRLDEEIKRLSVYCESLVDDIKLKTVEMTNLKDELIQLTKKNEDNLSLKNQLEEELSRLKIAEENDKILISDISRKLEEEKTINHTLKQQATNIECRLTLANSNLIKLQEQYEKVTAELQNKEAAVQAALDKFNDELAERERAHIQIEELEDKLRDNNKIMEEKIITDKNNQEKIYIFEQTVIKEKNTLIEEIKRLEKYSESLLEEIQQEKQANVSLNEKMTQLCQDISVLEQKNLDLSIVKSQLETELDGLKQNSENNLIAFANIKDELVELKKKNEDTLLQKNQLEEQLDQLRITEEANKLLISDISSKLEEEKTMKDTLKQQVTEMESQLTLANTDLTELQEQYEKVNAELQDKAETVQVTLVKLNDEMAQRERAHLRITELEDKIRDNTKVVEEKIITEKNNQEKIYIFEQAIIKEENTLDEEIKRLEKYSESLLEEIQQEKQANVSLNEKITQLCQDMSVLERRNVDTSVIKTQLEAELADLKQKIENNLNTLANNKDELIQLTKENEDTLTLKNQLEEELNKLNTAEKNDKILISEISRKLDEEKTINDTLRQQSRQMECQLISANSDLTKLQEQYEKVNAELRDNKAAVQTTLDKVNAELTERERAHLHIAELQDKLRNSTKVVEEKIITEKNNEEKIYVFEQTVIRETETLNGEIKRLEKYSESLLEEIDRVKQENLSLNEKIAQLHQDMSVELEQAQLMNKVLETQIDEMENQLVAAKAEIDKLQKQQLETCTYLRTKEDALKNALMKSNDHSAQMENTILQMKELETKLCESRQEKIEARQKICQLEENIQTVHVSEKSKLGEKLKTMDQSLNNAIAENLKLKTDLFERESSLLRLNQLLEQEKIQKEKVCQSCQESERKLIENTEEADKQKVIPNDALSKNDQLELLVKNQETNSEAIIFKEKYEHLLNELTEERSSKLYLEKELGNVKVECEQSSQKYKDELQQEALKRRKIEMERNQLSLNVEKLTEELQEAVQKKSELESLLTESRDKLSIDLNEDRSRLSAMTEELDSAQKNLERYKLLEEEMAFLKTRLDEAVSSRDEYKETSNQLTGQLINEKSETNKKLKDLETAVEELKGELKKVNSDFAEYRDQTQIELDEVKLQRDNLNTKLTESSANYDGLKEEYGTVCQEKNHHYGKLETITEVLQKVEEKASIDTRNFTKSLELLTHDLQTYKNQLEAVTIEKSKLEHELIEARFKLTSISEETINKTENLSSITRQLETILNENQALSEALQGAALQMEEYDCKRNIREEHVKQLEHDLRNVEEEKRILLRSLDQTVEKLETKEEQLKELRHQATEYQVKLQKAETLLQQAKEEKTVISNFLDLNNSELAKVSQDNEEILEALEMSNKDKLELIEENRTLKIKLDDLQESYDRAYKEMCEVMSEKDKLTHDNAEVLGNLQTIIKEKEELFGELNKVSMDLEQLKKEHEALNTVHRQNIEAKTEEQDFALRIENLTDENKTLRNERDELKNSVKKFEEEKARLLLSLELSQKEQQKIKRERNEILQSQTELMKETESNIQRAHETAMAEKRDLLGKVDALEKERQKLREAYASVVSNNAKQETENVNLRKKIEERNQQLQQFGNLKDAYEKLLEENNKYMTEIDTVKFKRSKDREEFLNLLKKERDEADARQNKKVREVRTEYEEKLGKMKDKMIKLYREEVNKELIKVKGDQGDMVYFQKTIDELHCKLSESEETIQMLKLERDMLKEKENVFSRESLPQNGPKHSISSLRGRGNKVADRDSVISTVSVSSTRESYSRDQLQKMSNHSRRNANTRVPAGDFIEESITFSRRTSINSLGRNFEMEDEEDDMFNNKYLVDLKEGRCAPQTGRESNVSRMSELAWRNSMVPPHLKSSYPAETQFVSPTRFREDDLKAGNVALDDSLSKLLPGEKPRQKKDFGTTTYKKPGPPTPSKNGGRLSLQGNEIAPLRETNHASPPKKVTPSRLLALFPKRKETGTKENNENVTPKAPRRLSLFKNRK
ncbi:uncharacterized protein LOC143200443 isoform X2 [Rhynchophorus ferrugineus]|uniref:uncharacterized protein LOC143200443 isoform X2 n=1 Tax=Rhynchophorus ferrugineus TaxID=354439 RepID=UPI003FCDFC96